MATRLTDATWRKLAGAPKKATIVEPPKSHVLTAAEKEEDRKRKAYRKTHGPSVSRRRHVVTTDTPLEKIVKTLLDNTCRSLVLDTPSKEDTVFNDVSAAVVASALRNNRSVLAVTLRGLAITEVGACSIFESLKRNPTVRAVNVEHIGLTPKALRGLRQCVRENTGIIHLEVYQTGADDDPITDEALLAVHMNRLPLPDPVINPYENFLFAGLTGDTDDADADGYAWDAQSDDEGGEHFLEGEANEFEQHAGKLARPVCGHYMNGSCNYGSRCRHHHPERSEGLPLPPPESMSLAPPSGSTFSLPAVRHPAAWMRYFGPAYRWLLARRLDAASKS